MADMKRELLDKLVEELKESEDIGEVSLFTAEELDSPVDVVRALLIDMGSELLNMLGEYFFLPYEEEEVLYFTSVITITDEIEPDEIVTVSEAIARINYVLPCGCFALGDEGRNLVYRYTAPILADLDADKQMAMMLTAVDAGMMTVDKYEGYLMLAVDGAMTPSEMIDFIKGIGNEADS